MKTQEAASHFMNKKYKKEMNLTESSFERQHQQQQPFGSRWDSNVPMKKYAKDKILQTLQADGVVN